MMRHAVCALALCTSLALAEEPAKPVKYDLGPDSQVVDGVPKGYRKKALERLLDLEEERLRQTDASPSEIQALEEDRPNRRAHSYRTR